MRKHRITVRCVWCRKLLLINFKRPSFDRPFVEATGGQERLLRDRLAESKVAFHMVNTRRIRSFAASEGIRAKTDPIDAKLTYAFAVQKRLEPMRPPSKEQVLMADLMDRART